MKKYIEYIKLYIIRDSFNFTLLLISFTLVLFLLYNSIELLQGVKEEAAINEQYSNQVKVYVTAINTKKIKDSCVTDLFSILEKENFPHGKLITNVAVGTSTENSDVTILFANEERLAPLEKKQERTRNKGVYIGELFLQDTTKEGKESNLSILNDSYPVTAVYKNDVAGGYDNRVSVFWNTLTQKSKEVLSRNIREKLEYEMVLYVQMDSDEPLEKEYERLCSKLKEIGLSCRIEEAKKNLNFQSQLYQGLNKVGMGCVAFFALLNLCIVTWIFVARRQEEFSIRRAFGCGNVHLFLLLLKDIMTSVLWSIPITFLLEGIYLLANKRLERLVQFDLTKGVYLLVGIVAITLFATLLPFFMIVRKEITQGMRQKGGM
ncbi:MAG: FtsX-like permease family protein [Lachnospiraceae bacterium]|nr:hypothetical protein [Lachnospiraceae bacterium]MEE1342598.1 FtsX-like permease family protein [Lachnospiraceae bacterium]